MRDVQAETKEINQIQKLTDIIEFVDNAYLYNNRLSEKDLVDAAISGIVSKLDKNSGYEPDFENQKNVKPLYFGFEGKRTQNGLKIDYVVPGTANGDIFQENDELVRINELDLSSVGLMSASDIMPYLNSEEDNEYEIIRDKKSIVVRGPTVPYFYKPSVYMKRLNDNTAYIKIDRFDKHVDAKMFETLRMIDEPYLIIDLRDNPGGFLNATANIVSFFVDPGTNVLNYMDANHIVFMSGIAHNTNKFEFEKIKVLINSGTVSSSEYMALALRMLTSAELIGSATHGKGTAQITKTYTDGSYLAITAHYYAVGNAPLPKDGVQPDIKIDAQPKIWPDEILNTALNRLEEGK